MATKLKIGPSIQISLVVLVGAALCAGVLLIWFHKSLIYRFDETPTSPEAIGIVDLRQESFLSQDGQMIRAWISMPVGDAPVILFFPGNFSSSIASVKKLLPFVERCYGIAVLEYRGMGGAPGVPSEHNFHVDARELYDQLDTLMGHNIAAERRVLYGFSLGTGVAIPLALERKVAALVLESPFASLTDFFTQKFRGLPMNWLMWSERYDMLGPVAALNIPTMLLRGELDNAIPAYSFEALAQSASPQTVVKRYPAAGHADLAKHGAVEDILDFVQKNTRVETQSGPPENDSGDCHGGLEVDRQFVVAGRDASPVFQSAERPLDQVPADTGDCVVRNGCFSGSG